MLAVLLNLALLVADTAPGRGACRLDTGWLAERFEGAFKEATPANAGITVFVQDPTLGTRAATMWGKGRWWVHYNPLTICPIGAEADGYQNDLGRFIERVAVHEACHVVRHGDRLKSDEPIGISERMLLEQQAEVCAFGLIAEWESERGR